jgi:site-specific DNA-methyltransferase (adenine-specific)
MEFNKIFNKDCFDAFKLIHDSCIDLVLVDLPYGISAFQWDVKIDLKLMWENLKRICKHNTQYIFFTTSKFGFELIQSNPSYYRYDLVWEKYNSVGFLRANKMPLRSHEMIYIFNKPRIPSSFHRVFNPQKLLGKPYHKKEGPKINGVYGMSNQIERNNTGERHPKSVLKFHQSDSKIHPTQKPVLLCEWLIKTYSNENDVVLDFTMGSGSTIIAAINTHRQYIGIEKDNEIFKIAEDRINKHKKKEIEIEV